MEIRIQRSESSRKVFFLSFFFLKLKRKTSRLTISPDLCFIFSIFLCSTFELKPVSMTSLFLFFFCNVDSGFCLKYFFCERKTRKQNV